MTAGRPGRFITVDGPGGAGKSTTVAALVQVLAGRGEQVHATTEPSRSTLGRFIRENADDYSGVALACLVVADRHHHLAHEVVPRLESGITVVCDRYLASTLVVQALDGVPQHYLLNLNVGIRLPDLAVILTASRPESPHAVPRTVSTERRTSLHASRHCTQRWW